MTDKIDVSKGRYWDRAWSLIDGCTPVSEACDHCWLRGINDRFKKGNFNDVKMREDRLCLPSKRITPAVWAVWADIFHEKVEARFISRAMRAMYDSHQHTFLLLTKRAQRMAALLRLHEELIGVSLPNIWFGTTVENQKAVDERLPHLIRVPGKRFLSVEPMLGPVDINRHLHVDAVICGCESGPGRRETKIEWVRDLRDQCEEAGVPFFLKQLDIDGKVQPMPMLDGKLHDKLPWIREG